MVDIHSVAASSHPSRREREGERESEREATSRSRAGQSRRTCGCMDATTVMLESQGYDRISTDSNGHRCRVAGSAPAAQQPTSVRSVALSGRAVASRRRPARRRRHQHTTSREAALAICAAVVHSISSACTICGVSTLSAVECTPVGAASRWTMASTCRSKPCCRACAAALSKTVVLLSMLAHSWRRRRSSAWSSPSRCRTRCT
jgi:hypothetical protein